VQQGSVAGSRKQLREQLKNFGFEDQVINAVLHHESSATIGFEEALDLCLAHNEFQVPVPSSHPFPRLMRIHAGRK
jgi:hypothetical protein